MKHDSKHFGKLLKTSSKFGWLVQRCLALPYILLDELQEVMDDLRSSEMDSEAATKAAKELMDYFQETWMDGHFNPETWSCFGRKTDMTNNSQEAYNGILNRSIKCFETSFSPSLWPTTTPMTTCLIISLMSRSSVPDFFVVTLACKDGNSCRGARSSAFMSKSPTSTYGSICKLKKGGRVFSKKRGEKIMIFSVNIEICRLAQVAHPNIHSLVRVIVQELILTEDTLTKVAVGQEGRRPTKNIFKIMLAQSGRLQKLYIQGTFCLIWQNN